MPNTNYPRDPLAWLDEFEVARPSDSPDRYVQEPSEATDAVNPSRQYIADPSSWTISPEQQQHIDARRSSYRQSLNTLRSSAPPQPQGHWDMSTPSIFSTRSTQPMRSVIQPSSDISNSLVRDVYNIRNPPASCYGNDWCTFDMNVGIELELEGIHIDFDEDLRSDVWRVEHDGSLRNYGAELVSRGPVSGTRLEKALVELKEFLEDHSPEYSERCSTHIHVDVTDLTLNELNTFLGCAIMMEAVLFRLHGQGREFNGFCCPVFTNSNLMQMYIQLFSDPSLWYRNTEFIKYAGISLFRLRDLGTVEFRMFNAVRDPEELKNMLHLLAGIKKFSKTVQSPEGLIDFKRVNSVRSVYDSCTQSDYNPEFEMLLEQGVQTLNDICIAVRTDLQVQESTRGIELKMQELQRERDLRVRGVPVENYNLGA